MTEKIRVFKIWNQITEDKTASSKTQEISDLFSVILKEKHLTTKCLLNKTQIIKIVHFIILIKQEMILSLSGLLKIYSLPRSRLMGSEIARLEKGYFL